MSSRITSTPGHVRVDAAGRLDADHLAHEVARPEEQLARDLPVTDDSLLAVDVVEEEVERAHPLDQAALEPVPLRAGDHPRDQVEREDPLDPLLLAVDREADPLVHERELDRAPPLLELLEAEPAELHGESPIVPPRLPDRLEHLVVERAGVVRLPERPGRRGWGCGRRDRAWQVWVVPSRAAHRGRRRSRPRRKSSDARLQFHPSAPVAQWIEQRFPKPRAQVRFLSGALSIPRVINAWPRHGLLEAAEA